MEQIFHFKPGMKVMQRWCCHQESDKEIIVIFIEFLPFCFSSIFVGYSLQCTSRFVIQSTQSISRVSWLKITDVSGAAPVSIIKVWRPQILEMETELVPETSVNFNQLTRLIDREEFINYSRHESNRIYIILHLRKYNNCLLKL
jgi:hypothetical protein